MIKFGRYELRTTDADARLVVFEVTALERAVETTRAAGGVVLDPVALPGGDTLFVCDDPQGAAFALRERRPCGLRCRALLAGNGGLFRHAALSIGCAWRASFLRHTGKMKSADEVKHAYKAAGHGAE